MKYTLTYELIFDGRPGVIDAKNIIGTHRIEFPDKIELPGVGDHVILKGNDHEHGSNTSRTIIGRVESRLFDYCMINDGSCGIRYTLRVVKDEIFKPGQKRDYVTPESIGNLYTS